MATKTVLRNVHWSQPGFAVGTLEHHLGREGEHVDIDDKVWASLSPEQQAAFGTDDDLAALVAAEPGVWTPAGDAELQSMKVEELHAYLNQVPEDDRLDEADRIVELEQAKSRPRASVLSIADEYTVEPE